ncbi:MAG: type I-D CRISPR-associated protein Cas7/Csc2 [Candidatus Thorarchaeota archaeon]|nr:MAG: type I-D CRISPR-associated protein Cas7/Csc2 [Candidatus Thorarchaeota archaeon]
MSKEIGMPSGFKKIKDYMVDSISPLLDSKVVQILVLRQTHDYTVLRTEESRELNTVVVPENINSSTPVVKVAFLASKQKAVESRMFARLLRNVRDSKCYLKDALCMKCPRCVLFGAVNVRGGREYNLKHRIEYSTAYSIERYEDLLETLTFNAVDSVSQSTGQALGLTHNVKPLANFPSVVTLNSATWQEVALYIKTLLASKSYGAETRVKGDVRNTILGIVAGLEEVITPLEYSLEMAAIFEGDLEKTTHEILERYKDLCGSRANVAVLTVEETKALVEQVQDLPLDKSFVDSMYSQVDAFLKVAKQDPKKVTH